MPQIIDRTSRLRPYKGGRYLIDIIYQSGKQKSVTALKKAESRKYFVPQVKTIIIDLL